jgi:steroid 5-alpha reductase family enzyme
VLIWSIRLTVNWIRRWKGIRDEDWRYVNFRKIFPRFYWLISFSGIHLLPTIVVFLACISVFPALVDKSGNLDLFDGLGTTISFIAILIETLSDEQLKRFLQNSKGQSFLRTGLWKYSRHPNYFGEVLFWIGIFLFSQGHESFYWWTLPGPIVMIALFHFISVPMIDKRMIARKPGYEQYFKETSGWIPWFPKGR